jgi:orotate phosphoribosyltransferase
MLTLKKLAADIYKASYITGEFLLRSGKISNEYFDKYQFESDPTLVNMISNYMLDLLPDIDSYDMFGALEMGGIPLATLLSVKTGKPVLFVRKKSKEYGTRKFAEGPDYKGKNILIVEDVVTSGGQIIISANDLRQTGAIIQNAVCVIDRQSGGSEALAAENIHLKPLFKMDFIKQAAAELL